MTFDVLVIGAGAAGLTAALNLAPHARVGVLAKGESSTAWAQGGIAAVLEPGDTFEAHIADTLAAGAGLCDPRAVEFVVERAPAAIERLAQLGVPFTPGKTVSERFHLTREGGHSARRIVHVDDMTGWAVARALEGAAAANPSITLLPDRFAIDLIGPRQDGRAWGVYALNARTGRVEALVARAVILATGGASRVYQYSTNPDGSTGDGIAMAWRAGARVANMEFNQFHPTCLYHPKVKNFLLTEALRGEGAYLRLPTGERFMPDVHPMAELAPRDIVARAIDAQMKAHGHPYVLLDISHREPHWVRTHFPNIYKRLLELGHDLTREGVPVVPAAHYSCGGVMIDLAGRTDVEGLYAVGEVSCSGLHGANRMASNSLLECLVFGQSAAEDIVARLPDLPPPAEPAPWDESRVTDSDEEVVVSHNWAELRRFMWDYVGIVRTDKRLDRAAHRITLLTREINQYYAEFRVTPNLIELRNLVQVADLIVRSAKARRESRGLHYTLDCPDTLPTARDTILHPPGWRTRENGADTAAGDEAAGTGPGASPRRAAVAGLR